MKKDIKQLKIGDVIKGSKDNGHFISVIDSNSPNIKWLQNHFNECERRGYKVKRIWGKERWDYMKQYGLYSIEDILKIRGLNNPQ